MMIHASLIELIGNTPIVELPVKNARARLLAKLESFNPGGSAKDRVALFLIEQAEKDGLLKPGATIIEPTSGNTGIGLAWVGKLKGYRCMLTMPDTMSSERIALLKAYGAEVILTPGSEGMSASIAKAEQLHDEIQDSFIPGQFRNPANPLAHEIGTAGEIWRDTGGTVDVFAACLGTGGTLCGTSRGLKKHNASIRTYGVEPASSPLLTKGYTGQHKIQGIGADFIPENYDPAVVDHIIDISDADAYRCARELTEYGILAGISSGAAFAAAKSLALDKENEGKTIVTILPDTGERYLSTELFQL